MPTYQALIDKGPADGKTLQKERLDKIRKIQDRTGRPLIVYFSNFIKGGNIPNNSIDDSDVTAFSDLIENIPRDSLDVLIHSPGGLAEICNDAEELTRKLSIDWLTRYMLAGQPQAAEKAEEMTGFFTSHKETLSHRRGIGIDRAKELGLKVFDLRSDQKLREAIWNLYCAVEFFVDQSDTAKFYENAHGVSWRRRFQVVQVQMQAVPQPPKPKPGGGKK